MLSAEEEAIIADIESQIYQLKSIDTAKEDADQIIKEEEFNTQEENNMAENMSYTEEENEMMKEMDEKGVMAYKSLKKSLAEKGLSVVNKAEMDKGTTARQDAESRLEDDQPEESTSNVSEVAKTLLEQGFSESQVLKSILALEGKETPVKKSIPVEKSNNVEDIRRIEGAINKLAGVMKSMVDQQDVVTDAVSNIYEGLGIAGEVSKGIDNSINQVNKSIPRRKVRLDTPSAREKVLKEIEARRGNVVTPQSKADVRKDLSGAMADLFSVGN